MCTAEEETQEGAREKDSRKERGGEGTKNADGSRSAREAKRLENRETGGGGGGSSNRAARLAEAMSPQGGGSSGEERDGAEEGRERARRSEVCAGGNERVARSARE